MRAAIGIQRDIETIRRAGRKRARRLAQAANTHVTHHRKAGRGSKCPHHVVTRDAAYDGHVLKCQRFGEMAVDVPERPLSWIYSIQALMRSATSCAFEDIGA